SSFYSTVVVLASYLLVSFLIRQSTSRHNAAPWSHSRFLHSLRRRLRFARGLHLQEDCC
ncbi:uncharacterized protein V1518DRAFT_433153, partial [Limtongia smithiae]|uniref:uncharacterized protein n=1 Tax=Limtongia smithiae TaxID=1125753 RepID=UPI0034CEBC41